MSSRRWLALIVGVLLAALTATPLALPELLRQVVIARAHALTHRVVSLEGVDLDIWRGRLGLRGFRIAERGADTPFADFERLDVRVHLPSLLRGRLWIHELVLRNSTVRVVRLPTHEFNLSDLIQSSDTTDRVLDVTVDRFTLVGGTVTLEDRALPEWRTWTSGDITIEARNLSTRRTDGSAVATSVTAGAPVRIEMTRLRLHPIEFQATVTVEGLDLALARLYLPPDAPVVLDRGRATSTLTLALDARAGVRAEATGHLEDVVLVRPGEREPLARVPKLTTQLSDLVFQDGRLHLGRFEIAGSASVVDPTAPPGSRLQLSTVRASVTDLTWPVTTSGRIEVLTSVPGGGTLSVAGAIRPPPAPTQLRLRLANLDLAPWARLLPGSARVSGVAEADLRVNEPLAAGVPTRVQGSIAVAHLGVRDDRQEILRAQRVEATGLEVDWPSRVVVERLLVTGPRTRVERDKDGSVPLRGLWIRPADGGGAVASPAPSLALDIGAIVVRDGAVTWRDAAVSPPVRLDVSRINATVTRVGWPLRGAAEVRVAARPPGGGAVTLVGRVAVDPLTADLRVGAKAADLAPYQPYLSTAARISGSADLDLAVLLAPVSEGRATVRGSVHLSRLDVRDGQRTVMRVERAAATGIDAEWPERVGVRQLALQAPWVLIERDETGALPLRALLTPRAANGGPPAASPADGGALAVAVARVAVEDGGLRVVDRGVSPAFAVDLQRLAIRVDGLSTAPAKPARVDLSGKVASSADLALRGTVGSLGGPLRLDVSGDLRGFAVPRTNSYMLRYVAWEAREGWLTTTLRCRIDGDALDAKTDIRVSRLQVAHAGTGDEAQARIGLPLGMIVALMKDARGDITVSLPVGGRLSDPRFDFTEAIWSTVRRVAINAITLPVSWIGRVQMSPDSRIERIEVDPIQFELGTATLTPEGQAQVVRVTAFLQQVSEVRMALTPVVSARDLAAIRRQALHATIERVARDARIPPDAAAARLFEQRFPRQPLPDESDGVLAALAESEPPSATEAPALAERRVAAVRDLVKKAGVDPARLPQTPGVESETAGQGHVQLELIEPDSPRRPRSQFRDLLRRLGATLTGGAASE